VTRNTGEVGTTRAGALLAALRHPVALSTRVALRDAWARVPPSLRTPTQFLGRQYAGCGATIGMLPRCDFACRGCYLGERANSAPARPVAEIKRQLERIRAWLGEGGNVQLTDGEVTLRPVAELVDLIRHARALGLVPMLMTHGDTFRRWPELLPRLMTEGGLSEVCIHIDTTQRGRRGAPYKHATRERELLPLRNEFAALIHRVRRRTRRPLDVATTYTVTSDNLDEVPLVMDWMRRNAGAFKMISFQPAAAVGRTVDGLGAGVTIELLWQRIADGLLGPGAGTDRLRDGAGAFGHPDCSRFVQGVVVRQPGAAPAFHPLFRFSDPTDADFMRRAMERFGGLTCRLDDRWTVLARWLGVLAHDPRLVLVIAPRQLVRWLRRFDPAHPWRLLGRLMRGRARIDYLNVVSHHFMSAAELATPTGKERTALCTFQVPIGERLVSMCEVNALGVRERFYAAAPPV
jgi:7,8-dihydro-6-hydroxymethylpterin dimethyltransferase